MHPSDIDLRNATYRMLVELRRAPTAREVAQALDRAEAEVRDGWRRLADAHALVLDERGEILMANPFSAVPTPFRVQAAGTSWYGNCAWDAFGIGAALHVDSVIEASCADCHEPMRIEVRDGRLHDEDLLFHVLVPALDWWQDIGFT
jgi:hypothetical protein